MFSFASFSRAFPQIRRYLEALPTGSLKTAGSPASTDASPSLAVQLQRNCAPAGAVEPATPIHRGLCDRVKTTHRRSMGHPLTYSAALRHDAR